MHQIEFRVKELGIKIFQKFVGDSEELFKTLETGIEWDERMRAGKAASFGVSYNYSGISYAQNEMHPRLVSVCNSINFNLGFLPNNCLLNYCLGGKSSMWHHSDSSEELFPGTVFAIVSLGAVRSMACKNKANKNGYKIPT